MPAIATTWGFILRLLLATFLGVLIGFERQWRRHTAGILTNAIVCIGACMFVSFSLIINQTGDVTRIAAQVVSGVGFLGAGVILRDGFNIRGLNTAATVWASSAVGVLCTLDSIWYAVFAAFAILLTHTFLYPLSRFVNKKRFSFDNQDDTKMYNLKVECDKKEAQEITREIIDAVEGKHYMKVASIFTKHLEQKKVIIHINVSSLKDDKIELQEILASTESNHKIMSYSWVRVE